MYIKIVIIGVKLKTVLHNKETFCVIMSHNGVFVTQELDNAK